MSLVFQERLKVAVSAIFLHVERLSNHNQRGDGRRDFLLVFQEARGCLE